MRWEVNISVRIISLKVYPLPVEIMLGPMVKILFTTIFEL